MAVINKTGITNGGTVQAEHVTRAIDALSGVSTDTIIATGSFSGSFRGTIIATGSFSGSFRGTTTGSAFTTQLTASGSVTFNSASVTFNSALISANGASSIDLSAMGTSESNRGFRIPTTQPTAPATGSMYFTDTSLRIFDGTTWQVFTAV